MSSIQRRLMLKQLTRSVSQWNAWRESHSQTTIVFSGADLSGADLSGANLSGANLNYADLSGANLSGADLIGAKLSGADLNYADLNYADLNYADLSRANLSRANLIEANLIEAKLSGADLIGADLSRAKLIEAKLNRAKLSRAKLSYAMLSRADLNGADLSGADLNGADLNDADLNGADLNDADLIGANLSGANLSGANLSGADLIGADLSRAKLIGANLSRAKLIGANLSRADLSGADLTDADLTDADLNGADLNGADLNGADLSGADLNETKFSNSPSSSQIYHSIVISTSDSTLSSPNLLAQNPLIFSISEEEMTKQHFFPIQVLYCYALQDRGLRDELEKHLMVLKRLKQITLRLNREISAGTNWKMVQDERFHQADLILLLVSPDFVASDYHYGVEMHQALEKHKAGNVLVIPILLRSIAFWQQTPMGVLQVLPQNGKAITDYPERDQDQVLTEVVRRIGEVVSSLFLKKHPFLQGGNVNKVTQALGPFCATCGARNLPNIPVCENCGDVLL